MNLGLNSALKSQFDRVDNSPIVIFRMAFGLLIFAESAGAIATGWVKETFVEPAYTFTVIGLDVAPASSWKWNVLLFRFHGCPGHHGHVGFLL